MRPQRPGTLHTGPLVLAPQTTKITATKIECHCMVQANSQHKKSATVCCKARSTSCTTLLIKQYTIYRPLPQRLLLKETYISHLATYKATPSGLLLLKITITEPQLMHTNARTSIPGHGHLNATIYIHYIHSPNY